MKFKIGQVIHHKLFDYRGVIYRVDEVFEGTDEWYDLIARTKPPRDKPWYRVFVHNGEHTTYVAERNLEVDMSGDPVEHPFLPLYFDELKDGQYNRTSNWSGETPILPPTNGRT